MRIFGDQRDGGAPTRLLQRPLVVTRDSYLCRPELGDELVHVIGNVREIKAIIRNSREPHPAQIGNDHAMFLCQLWGDEAPYFA